MVGRKIYIIGSLQNPLIRDVGKRLRADGHDVFDEWHGAGKDADSEWRNYELHRGRSYVEALKGRAAQHIFQFDLKHLDWAEVGVMVMPAGKSAHLELGYMRGSGKKTYILFDKEPERYDVMHNFAHGVYFDVEELAKELKRSHSQGIFTKAFIESFRQQREIETVCPVCLYRGTAYVHA